MQHFSGTRVLTLAVKRSYKKLVLPMVFLFMLTFLFAAFIYSAERGSNFFCPPEYKKTETSEIVHYCNVRGELTQFEDIFRAAWLVMVTMTSVG